MATTEMTEKNFEEIVTTNDIVFIDFWAAWCGPCRSFAPTYEKVALKHPDIVFAKVDTEAEQGLASAFAIMSIPTLMIMRENIVLFSQAGALPEAALEQLITKVRELDMQEVRRAVHEEQSAHS